MGGGSMGVCSVDSSFGFGLVLVGGIGRELLWDD